MRILCSNDDGIHADGLASLVKIAQSLSDDVWVVAPSDEQSGASRALTLSQPLRVRKHDDRRFSVSGTPTDCVLMALTKIIDGKKPDLILSGINNGQNLAEDVTLSGTVAAAFQGMNMGIPSIAMSLARFDRANVRWATPEHFASKIIRDLLAVGWPDNVVINVNFPDRDPADTGPVEVTTQGHRDQFQLYAEERQDLRGGAYFWYGYRGTLSNPPAGTDLAAIYEGRISVCLLYTSPSPRDS